MELSIVIPAFNEEQRIGPTLEGLSRFLTAHPLAYELIVVDDGSRDGTAALVERLAEKLPNLRLLRQTPNRGKGAAVRAGMLAARGRIRVFCDADGSMPPEELPKLLAPVAVGDVDVAIGSRYVDGASHVDRAGAGTATKESGAPKARSYVPQPAYRRLWSRLCNKVVQRALVPGVRDTQCGYKAFTAEAAQDLFARATIDGWAFDLEILALARRRCYGIAEIAVTWVDDRRSRINPIKDMWKVIKEAVTIRKNLRRGIYGQLAPC